MSNASWSCTAGLTACLAVQPSLVNSDRLIKVDNVSSIKCFYMYNGWKKVFTWMCLSPDTSRRLVREHPDTSRILMQCSVPNIQMYEIDEYLIKELTYIVFE